MEQRVSKNNYYLDIALTVAERSNLPAAQIRCHHCPE